MADDAGGKRRRRKKKAARPGLSLYGGREFKAMLRGEPPSEAGAGKPPQVCSEPWAEDIARRVTEETPLAVDRNGRLNAKPAAVWLELAKADLLPMPGQVVCTECGVPYPPNYVTSSGHCVDCHDAALTPLQASRLPRSHSAVIIQRLRDLRARLETVKTRDAKAKNGARKKRPSRWRKCGFVTLACM